MIACLTIHAHPETNLPILSSVFHAFFSGLDGLMVKMDLSGIVRIAPCTFSEVLEDSHSRFFEFSFVSFIREAALCKQAFDSSVLAEVVLKLLACYLRHGECCYTLMDMDPDAYDPPLPAITDDVMQSLKKFFIGLKPGKNFEGNEYNYGYIGIELNSRNNSISTPPKGDPFWFRLSPTAQSTEPRDLRPLAEPTKIKLIVGSANFKKLRCHIDGMDGEFKIVFFDGCFENEHAIHETIIEANAVLVDRYCYVFTLLKRPEYPPFLAIKEGYQLNPSLFNFLS